MDQHLFRVATPVFRVATPGTIDVATR
jgi:hypothetical protein